ncbi:MAG: DUF1016 N-terminal domain-containing protein [Prevotellaceae bacterium]|nr:DUF1016 N-terminal domain-containing protein [Prevotellaceae bacterium]
MARSLLSLALNSPLSSVGFTPCYVTFPIRDAARPELNWSHYRKIMKVENEQARRFYIEERIKSRWSILQTNVE